MIYNDKIGLRHVYKVIEKVINWVYFVLIKCVRHHRVIVFFVSFFLLLSTAEDRPAIVQCVRWEILIEFSYEFDFNLIIHPSQQTCMSKIVSSENNNSKRSFSLFLDKNRWAFFTFIHLIIRYKNEEKKLFLSAFIVRKFLFSANNFPIKNWLEVPSLNVIATNVPIN